MLRGKRYLSKIVAWFLWEVAVKSTIAATLKIA